MQRRTLVLGILFALVLGGLFWGAQPTEAQTTSTATSAAPATITVSGAAIPIIPGTTSASPYFNIMNTKPGKQAFVVNHWAGTDLAQQYLIVEAGDSGHDEADVYLKVLASTYRLVDCESAWYSFSSAALDFSDYLGNPVSFDSVLDAECDKSDITGNYSIESFFQALNNGKSSLPTINGNAPVSVDAPGVNTTPTTASVNTLINAGVPAPSEACNLSGGNSVQYIKMSADGKSATSLKTPIPAIDTSDYAKQPHNIVFTDAGDRPQYLLQVWHFSTNELIAQSVLDRFQNAKDSMWDLIWSTALQGTVDTILWLTPIDTGHPIDAAQAAISSYNSQFPSKSQEVSTNTISLLPGLGKLAVGTRLCVFEDGTPKSYWGKIYFDKDAAISIPNPALSIGYTATFIPTNNQKGTVAVNFGILQSLVPGSTDKITYANIDASKDAQKSVFRFRLSDETLAGIKTGDSTLNTPPANEGSTPVSLADIQNKMSATLVRNSDGKKIELKLARDLEGLMFGSTELNYFTSAPVLEPATGRPTKIDTSEPFYPGAYKLVIRTDGYKDYKTEIAVTPSMLSGSDTSTVTKENVFKLNVKGMKLTKNCTITCTNLLACLACLNAGVVENYSPALTSK